ncbi:hypothetical protein [Nocardia sp. NPDC005825]|uniref:hypothetical protein n=1 Tax=unclassified Nocardia TaxID=2637762 RepID=UPI0033D0273D
MRTSVRTLAAAGITATASALTALAAGPAAHADVTGTGMTVQGSNFQVGQTYNVVIPVSDCTGGSLSDTSNGVTVRSDWKGKSSIAGQPCMGTTSTWTFQWKPLTPGTHVLGFGYGNSNVSLPPYTDMASATVQVSGSGSTDPQACDTACTTVHGTPQVGCTLTVTMSTIPASLATSSGSSLLQSLSSGTPTRNAWFDDNGTGTATTTITGTSVTMKWTPTTTGYHHLAGKYDTGAQPPFLGDGIVLPGYAGDIWLQVAPTGTQPCA